MHKNTLTNDQLTNPNESNNHNHAIFRFTGRELMKMFALIRGIPRKKINDMLDELAAALLLTGFLTSTADRGFPFFHAKVPRLSSFGAQMGPWTKLNIF